MTGSLKEGEGLPGSQVDDLYQPTANPEAAAILHTNLNSARVPGMTVYVSPKVRKSIEEGYQRAGYDAPFVRQVAPGIDALHYPDGVWLMGLGAATLYQHSLPGRTESERYRGYDFYHFPYEDIFRIEGVDGAAWQNKNYVAVRDVIEGLREKKHDDVWLLAISVQRELALECARALAEDTTRWPSDMSEEDTSSKIRSVFQQVNSKQRWRAIHHPEHPANYEQYGYELVFAALHEEIKATTKDLDAGSPFERKQYLENLARAEQAFARIFDLESSTQVALLF